MTNDTKLPGFAEEQQAGIEPEAFRWLENAELEHIGRKADAWLVEHDSIVASLAPGTILMIEVESGGHESGMDHEAVRKRFRARFGASKPGFVHRVGRPYYVGAGLWALRSEA